MSLVRWRLRRFTPRMRDQLVEAERLAGVRLTPTQGSFNTSVEASAGTHAREAVDLSVRGYTRAQEDDVIVALDTVGIDGWVRPANGKWVRHIHGIPRGGDLSPSAQRQVAEAAQGGDGLVGNAPDPHAHLRGPRRTWEQYVLTRWPLPADHVFGDRSRVPLWNIAKRRRIHDGTANSAHAAWVRRIKRHVGIAGGGSQFGPVTTQAVGYRQRRDGIESTGNVGRVTAQRWGLLD